MAGQAGCWVSHGGEREPKSPDRAPPRCPSAQLQGLTHSVGWVTGVCGTWHLAYTPPTPRIRRPPRGPGAASLHSTWSLCSGEKWGLGHRAVLVWPWLGSRALPSFHAVPCLGQQPPWATRSLEAHAHTDTFTSQLSLHLDTRQGSLPVCGVGRGRRQGLAGRLRP